MMAVHMQIAFNLYGQIKQAMPCEALQHMVKKSDSRADVTFSGTVQIQGNSDIRLFGRSGYGCLAASAHLLFHWPALLKITIQILL